MGLEAATLAAIGLGTSVAATAVGISQNQRQRKAAAAGQAEQKAANAAQAAEEQRQKIREERIKRARIEQAAFNTGTNASSGEAGALGSLSTQLGVNLGSNSAAVNRANTISNLNQQAADAAGNAQIASAVGQWAPTTVRLADSIFSTNPQSTELQGPLINTVFPNQK